MLFDLIRIITDYSLTTLVFCYHSKSLLKSIIVNFYAQKKLRNSSWPWYEIENMRMIWEIDMRIWYFRISVFDKDTVCEFIFEFVEPLSTPELSYRTYAKSSKVKQSTLLSLPTDTNNLSVRCAVRGGPEVRIRWECQWIWKNKAKGRVNCTDYSTLIKEKVLADRFLLYLLRNLLPVANFCSFQ